MKQTLRIFISSPGDVQEERLRAHLVVQKLARDYTRFFQIQAYLWEHEPMLASGHFQDAIELPSASDIVILVVYSRLGTTLPERSATREYRGLDGRTPVTGTEWEFEEALAANRSRGAPDLLAYRKLGDPGASLADTAKRAEQERQWDALEAFWRRHFETGTLFLAGSAKFRSLDEFDQKLEQDLVSLIERRIAGSLDTPAQAAEATWLKGSPFRGLTSYDFGDAAIFFGRDAQVRDSLTRLQAAAERGSAFLLILGASGSGKSSVARAGVLPALFAPKAIPGVAIWRRVVMRPGEGGRDPVVGLAEALVASDGSSTSGLRELVSSAEEVGQLARHLAASADDPSYPIRQALDRVIAVERVNGALLPHETARLVLLVDQMEELFTRVDAARRDLFVRILAGLARSGCVWVVATMRNDFWHRAVDVSGLVGLVESGARIDLPPPDGAQMIEIIRRPAAAAGLSFETDAETGVGLDAVIARAAAEEPGALPLLSVMLEQLYQRDIASRNGDSGPGHQLRFASYRNLGELRGAIARRADDLLDGLAATDPEAAASLPHVLRALVTASAQGAIVTARVARADQFAEGSPQARLVSAMLSSEARLLVASSTAQGGEIRLAHEALIENWPRAREQIARDRRDLETRSRLEALLRRWADAANPAERGRALLTGLNLAEGSDLVARWDIGTGELAIFVAASARAERWRRRRAVIAASVLLCIFGAMAAWAIVQWKRADQAAEVALGAQQTERQARSAAETERARATANEQRATEALRQTRRETAHTLATQVEIASAEHDVRRAIGLAVQAGTLEKEALGPGETPASEPALLRALAGAREVLHVTHAAQRSLMPYGFRDDSTLVWADAHGGLVEVDLSGPPRVAARVPLPHPQSVNHLAFLAGGGLIALTQAEHLSLIDMRTGQIRATLTFPERINGIDADPQGRGIVVASGATIGFVDPDKPDLPAMIAVPDANPEMKIGQVRFARAGHSVLVTYGAGVLEYDMTARSFTGKFAELSGAGVGVDQATLNAVLASGAVPFVRLHADLGDSGRAFTVAPLELQAFEPGRSPETLRSDRSDLDFRGLSPADQERQGHATTMIGILGRNEGSRQEFQLRYVSGSEGLLLGNDGRLQQPFESLVVASGDLAHQKPDTCQASSHLSFLACQYSSKQSQGIVVWRMLGGNHAFERIAEGYGTSSAVMLPGGDLLTTGRQGLARLTNGRATKLADLPDDWRLTGAAGDYLIAQSAAAKQGRVFRLTDRQTAQPVSPPLAATAMSFVSGTDRVLVRDTDRLGMIELASGHAAWTAPIDAVRFAHAAASRPVVAVAAGAVYLLDAASGRTIKSHTLAMAPNTPLAVDPRGQKLAYLDARNRVAVLALETGDAATIDAASEGATQLVWADDSETLLIGGSDGGVLAWKAGNGRLWSVASPFDRSYRASAWPGQPPQGVVLQIALSHDGHRLAVLRQDMSTVDIHDMANGKLLTQLTPPWSTLNIPAQVSFGPNDEVVTLWAFHAMARDKPRFVTVHALPRGFDAALAAASARLAALDKVWSPEGPVP